MDRQRDFFAGWGNAVGSMLADAMGELATRIRLVDADHNGALSFNEYAAKGIEKFVGAGGRKGWLSPAEFVKTAPPPPKHKACSCNRASFAAAED